MSIGRKSGRFGGYACVAGLCLLTVLLLAGCGSDANSGQTQTSVSTTAAGQGQTAATSTAASEASTQTAPSTTMSQTTVEIGWAGDTTLGSKYGNPPNGGRALFANVRDLLVKPDIMMVNLEGTLSVGGTSKSAGKASTKSFSFQAPPANAASLAWAGIDLVNLANNHSHDFLATGLVQTKRALSGQHIEFTGMAGQITVVKSQGVSVAVLGFAPYSWTASLTDIQTAKALVKKATSEADLVVVIMHAGAEGSGQTHTPSGTEHAFGENRGNSRAFAHAVIDAGADLVLGSGPHVIRGIERYQGRLIAYSLGDFAGWGNFGLAGNLDLSGLLTVRLTKEGDFVGGQWYSLRLASPGVPQKDPKQVSLNLVREISRQDFPDTFAMSAQGAISAK